MALDGPGYLALARALDEHHEGSDHLWLEPTKEVAAATKGLLAGVRAYLVAKPIPHWHYVTFGLTDLGTKDSPDPEVSGFGFELTCRVPTVKGENDAPDWPFSVLVSLAAYVFENQTFFEPGHNIDLGGSFDGKGALTAIVFAEDPGLAPIETPNGRVDFIQMFGIDAEELAVVRSWNAAGFLDLARTRGKLLLSDPRRASLLEDPVLATKMREGIERDGSSQLVVTDDRIGWVRMGSEPRVDVTVGIETAGQLRAAVTHVLRKGRPFICMGKPNMRNNTIVFIRGEQTQWQVDEDGALVVQLAEAFLDGFAAELGPAAILTWPGLANLTLRVVPSAPSA